jgi:hypothetical protein
MQFDAQNDSVESPLVTAANRVINSLKVGDGAPLDTVVGLFFPTFVRDWVGAVLRGIPGTMANVGSVNRAFLMDVAERTANERRTRGEEDVMRSSDFLTYLARCARLLTLSTVAVLCSSLLLLFLPGFSPRIVWLGGRTAMLKSPSFILIASRGLASFFKAVQFSSNIFVHETQIYELLSSRK